MGIKKDAYRPDHSIQSLEEEIKVLKDKLKEQEKLLEQRTLDYELWKDCYQDEFRSFFCSIKEFLFLLDSEGRIEEVSQYVLDRLGYTLQEIRGQSVLFVHPPEERSEAERIVNEMLQGSTDCCTVPLMTKTGERIPVETRVIPGIWNNKMAIFGISKDLSRVRFTEEKFAKAFQSSLVMAGISEYETGIYVEVNDMFCKTLGLKKEEVIGKSSAELDLFDPAFRQQVFTLNDIRNGISGLEAVLQTRDGRRIPVLMSANLLRIQDKEYVYTTALDTSDRDKALSMMRESEDRLRELVATKDRFFSIIAHDLRNPFSAIIGFTALIDELCESKNYDSVRIYNHHIETSAKTVFDLLVNLLDWSRVQNGSIQFAPSRYDFYQQVEELRESFTAMLAGKNIYFRNLVDPGQDIIADKPMIATVMRNVLSNAIKFTPVGGAITVAIRVEDQVRINVTDTGVGIEPEDLKKMFRIEENFTTKGTNRETGTGLGLILCKDFMKLHGGDILASSALGKGSSFTLVFPILTEESLQEKG